MPADATRSFKSGQWAAYLLAAFAVLAPQLLGGATEITQLWIVVSGALVAACCALAFREHTKSLGGVPFAALGAGAAALWTSVQALPVPCDWVSWAQPRRAALNAALIELGAVSSPQCTLSLSPGATVATVSLACTIVALMLSATVAARAGSRRLLLAAVAISSVAMACVALGHAVADATEVFGLYTPRFARPQLLLAPLMNENHLAGHIALGFPLCMSFARSSERLDARIVWWTAALIAFATGLLTLSRGGAVALIVGGGAYLVTELRSRRLRKHVRATLVSVGVGLTGMALCTYFAIDLLAKQFPTGQSALQKLRMALKLGELALQHPWAGIGRGATGDVSAQLILRNERVLFAENIAVQWALEWGILAALLFAAAFAYSLLRLRVEQRAEKALACGLFALVLQNMVDFSLELAGVACVAAIALGVLVSREQATPRFAWLGERVRARPALLTSALAALAACAVSAPWLRVRARSALQREITAQVVAGSPAAAIRDRLEVAFASYPLDPMFLLLGTAAAVRDNAASVPQWLNLVFEAAPGWAAPHLQAAAFLERNGRLGQAAIELGLAVELDPRQSASSVAFLKRHPSAELAWAITAPGAPNEQRVREAMVDCLVQERLWEESETALLRLLERFPSSEYAHRRLVTTAANLGKPELALSRARAMARALPESAASVTTLAEMLVAHGQAKEALAIIDGAPKVIREEREVLLAEASVAARVPDERRLETALTTVLARYGTTTQARSSLLLFASQRLSSTGNHLGALSRAQAAYDLSGDPNALELAHQAAVGAGLLSAALRTAAELCNVGHRGRAFCSQQGPPGGIAP